MLALCCHEAMYSSDNSVCCTLFPKLLCGDRLPKCWKGSETEEVANTYRYVFEGKRVAVVLWPGAEN